MGIELKTISELLKKIRKRDFSGDAGLAIKNSMYKFGTTLIAKIGSLFFIMIMARLLMPELFGLYSLALATLVLFVGFTDLGIKSGLVLFLSRAFSKRNNTKAKSHLYYLFKIKISLVIIVTFILLLLSKFLSETYYQKPIFLALMIGVSYLFFRSFIGFFRSVFYALNDFKRPFYWEIFFQVCRLIIVPLAAILFLNSIINNNSNIFIIILALAFVWLLTLILILTFIPSLKFLKAKPKKIPSKEKSQIRKFLLPLSAVTLSGAFFGYLDIFVLGKFVLSEFIGYYQAAFSISGAIFSILTFSTALFPIFSRMNKKKSEKALSISVKIAILIGIIGTILTFVFAPLLIKIAFGNKYLSSIIFLQVLSILVLIIPINALYASHLLSRGKSSTIAKLLIFTTIINIILNYAVAFLLIPSGQVAIVLGICGTTIFSKMIYLGGLIFSEKKFKEKGK